MDMLEHIQVTLEVPRFVKTFYKKVSMGTELTAEEAMADMLLKVAGELSLQVLHEGGIEPEDVERLAEEREAAGLDFDKFFEDPDEPM